MSGKLVVTLLLCPVETLAEEKLAHNRFDGVDVLDVVRLLWHSRSKIDTCRPFQVSASRDNVDPWPPGRWTTGAFVHGGVAGLTRTSRLFPITTAFLCEALRRRTNHSFAALTVLVNCHSDQHVDSHNEASCLNVAWNIADGPHVEGIRLEQGELILPSNAWASFWPRVPHASLPGLGNRLLLVGYTPRSLDRLCPALSIDLAGLGLSWPSAARAFCVDRPMRDVVSSSVVDPSQGDDEEWEVSVSCPTDPDGLTPFLREMYVRVHTLKVHFGRREVHLAEEGISDLTSPPFLASLHAWQEDVEQQLQGDASWRAAQGDLEFLVRSAPRVVDSDPATPSPGLLHTRLVSNDEVRENLYAWKEAMAAEYQSLLSKNPLQRIKFSPGLQRARM